MFFLLDDVNILYLHEKDGKHSYFSRTASTWPVLDRIYFKSTERLTIYVRAQLRIMIMLHVFIICIRAIMYWKYVLLYFFQTWSPSTNWCESHWRKRISSNCAMVHYGKCVFYIACIVIGFSVRSIYYEIFTNAQTISH